MKVLVTGVFGFIGSKIAEELHKLGADVTGIDNFTTNTDKFYLESIRRVKRLTTVNSLPVSIESFCAVSSEEELKKFNVVIHCAAYARVQNSIDKDIPYYENNVGQTTRLLEKFDKCTNTRFIFLSSSSVVSDKELYPYSKSKKMAEEIVQSRKGSIVVRLFNVYGPDMPEYGVNSTLVGRLMYAIRNRFPIKLYGDGSIRRDFTHVDDVSRVIGELTVKGWGNTTLMDIGSGESVSIKEVMDVSGVKVNKQDSLPMESTVTKADTKVMKSCVINPPLQRVLQFIKAYRDQYSE